MKHKVAYQEFPLGKIANRTTLLTGAVTGAIPPEIVTAEVIHDNLPRPYRKPVNAYGTYYPTITEAAIACAGSRNYKYVKRWAMTIARACNADNDVRFYWDNPR